MAWSKSRIPPEHRGRVFLFSALHSVPLRSPSTHNPTQNHTHDDKKNRSGSTHTGELDATVTALGSGTLLLQVKVPELTTRSLDDANLVGPRVVPRKRGNPSICRSKNHLVMQLVDPDRSEYRFKRRGGIVREKGIFLSNVRVPAALQDGNHSQYFRSSSFHRRRGNSRIAVCC